MMLKLFSCSFLIIIFPPKGTLSLRVWFLAYLNILSAILYAGGKLHLCHLVFANTRLSMAVRQRIDRLVLFLEMMFLSDSVSHPMKK